MVKSPQRRLSLPGRQGQPGSKCVHEGEFFFSNFSWYNSFHETSLAKGESVMKNAPRICSWGGIALIATTGFIHVIEAPDSFHEAAYKGWLFSANGLGALVAAYGIYRGKRSGGWNLGLLIVVGSLIGYVASRTVGLPHIPAEPEVWFEPLGVASVIVEGLFVAVFMRMTVSDKRI